MTTISDYYKKIETQNIQRKNLPSALQKGWDYIGQVTKGGKDISVYETSEIVKRTIDLYLEKLEVFLQKKGTKTIKTNEATNPQKKTTPIKLGDKKIETGVQYEIPKDFVKKMNTAYVEKISVEIKMIKRYVNIHEKVKTKHQVRIFLNSLQRAITEKEIRKTSKHAKEIIAIQGNLIKLLDRFEKEQAIHVIIPSKIRAKYLSIIGKQIELDSVKFIKEYIGLQGKAIPTQKAKNLHNKIVRKVNSNSLTKKDKYWKEVNSILTELKKFVKLNPIGGELMIKQKTLSGLGRIVYGGKENLSGVTKPDVSKKQIMNSMDVIDLNFKKLGFKGKWLKLIGNPSRDFTAMIYGKPKMGKSYLAVDFSGYLARNHGTVLYVAREEGIDDTLQQKLKDKNVAHPDLDVSNYLPEDLEKYDFIFLDSVTKLGLSPEDLDDLKRKYPDKSFIYIFQSTKLGNFRGNNGFQHDVDVVIEISEIGKAVQFGRFNQGGGMNIFSKATK